MTQPDIWISTIEINWSDEKTPTVFQPAFTVVTTWAASPEEFREKCVRMLECWRATVGSCWTLNGRILCRKLANLAKKSKTC